MRIIEEISVEWTKGMICPVFKKEDRKLCLNCRGITLLNVTYKVFSFLIQKVLAEMVEHNMGHIKWNLDEIDQLQKIYTL
jgi:hypothetical protein